MSLTIPRLLYLCYVRYVRYCSFKRTDCELILNGINYCELILTGCS